MPQIETNKKEQPAYHEGLRRIEECRWKGKRGTDLNLGGLHLTTLPPQIGQLTALTGLFLDRNQLRALPPEIGQVPALTQLSLNINQLRALPREITRLTGLERLFLHDNRALGIPESVLGPTPHGFGLIHD